MIRISKDGTLPAEAVPGAGALGPGPGAGSAGARAFRLLPDLPRLVIMRVHVISDVHGRTDALATAADGADALICLGDLLLFVDYADHRRGIFADLFGAEAARQFIALRTAQRFDEARAMSARLWAGLGGDKAAHVDAAASRQYAELFRVLPTPSYLTYGNVDIPRMWEAYLRPGQRVLDGERVELGGWSFGFVGGGLKSPYRTPYEIDDEAYAAKVAAVGEVDVLCAHIPPDVPELLFDTVAQRLERGSAALLDAVRRTQPRYLLFGHVHQPLASRLRIGRTECVNVGHFRATGTPHVLAW
jgi:Icc-related predicted phosphoesterase